MTTKVQEPPSHVENRGKPEMPPTALKAKLEHRFNSDLLLSESDREIAKTAYPEIYHVIDHPDLRKEFADYDTIANRSKVRAQRVGFAAVVLATVALFFSAITPLLLVLIPSVPPWVERLFAYAEACGLIGAAIAAGGILIGGFKKEWLQARMMAEVIRLWHFQSFICRSNEIDASCNASTGGQSTFLLAREKRFKAFIHDWSSAPDSRLEELIEIPEAGYQLLHEETGRFGPNSAVAEKVFAAYRQLRFRQQVDYANHKLKKTPDKTWTALGWPVSVLQRRIEALASFCLIGSLLISLLIVIGYFAEWHAMPHAVLACGIIVLLIFNMAIRAVQDGLAVPEELQRYNDYGGKIRYLLTRFDATQDPSIKFHLMEEMERAALQELKGFLRAFSEAHFLV